MSATIKPEIFASWIPTGKIVLKPEIYTSWIPIGKIILEPLIFATYIPAPVQEKFSADTLRKISKEESAGVDTLRQVGQGEKFSADTKRALSKVEKAIADTSRKVGITIIRADLNRKIKSRITNSFDTCRKIGGNEIFQADTKRAVGLREKFSADTFLQIAATEKFIADTLRGLREIIRADTFRKITRTEKFSASTVIRIPHILKYVVRNRAATLKKSLLRDTGTSLINTFKDYGVTAINISLNEKTLSDEFTFDITQPMEINEAVEGYLLDYPFRFLVEEVTQTWLVRSVKGMYNQDKLLYTQFFLPTYKDEKDNEHVVLKTARAHVQTIASHLNLMASVHIENFTPYNLNGNHRITYADLISSLFSWTSRLPQRQINVFIRGGTLYVIQRGKEPSVFDITNLPHSQPTITKKLVRSLWSNPKAKNDDNDTDTDTDPIIEYLWEETQIPFSGKISFSDENSSSELVYQNGLLKHEKHSYENSTERSSSSATYNYIEVFYKKTELEIFMHKLVGDFYTAYKRFSATSTKIEDDGSKTIKEQYGSVEYYYAATKGGDLYLCQEDEITTTETYENRKKTDKETETRQTFHTPLGNGWYAQSVYINGEAKGSNISQGTPGNKISQYMLNEVQKSLAGVKITYTTPNDDGSEQGEDNDDPRTPEEKYEEWRRDLSPIADISFPVREFPLIVELTNDLRWLNRKTEETVTVDLISKVVDGVPEINHIVDFTELIKLDGGEYHLVSNKISFTPRKLIQKLQLIRWV